MVLKLSDLTNRLEEIEDKVGLDVINFPLHNGDVWTYRSRDKLGVWAEVAKIGNVEEVTPAAVKLAQIDVDGVDRSKNDDGIVKLGQCLLFSGQMHGHYGDLPVCSCSADWYRQYQDGREYLEKVGISDNWEEYGL